MTYKRLGQQKEIIIESSAGYFLIEEIRYIS